MNCTRCGAVNPEGARFCQNCGVTLGAAPGAPAAPAAPPAQTPGYPQPAAMPPPAPPVCPMCRSPYLQYFHNGRGTCATCRYIFGWGYTPYGQIVLYPNPGFLL